MVTKIRMRKINQRGPFVLGKRFFPTESVFFSKKNKIGKAKIFQKEIRKESHSAERPKRGPFTVSKRITLTGKMN